MAQATNEATAARVFNQAKKFYPENIAALITAQAMHETGNFKSSLFRATNNIFGMKKPLVRPHLGIASNRVNTNEGKTPYLQYDSVEQSVSDLKLWLDYNNFKPENITSAKQYAQWLKSKKYYGDTTANYTKGLTSAIEKLKGIKISKPLGIGAFIFAGVIAFFIFKSRGQK